MSRSADFDDDPVTNLATATGLILAVCLPAGGAVGIALKALTGDRAWFAGGVAGGCAVAMVAFVAVVIRQYRKL